MIITCNMLGTTKTNKNTLNRDAISLSVTSTLMYDSLSSHAAFLLFLYLRTVTRSVTANLQ